MAALVMFTAWDGVDIHKLAVNPAYVVSVTDVIVGVHENRWATLELSTGQRYQLFKMSYEEAVAALRVR